MLLRDSHRQARHPEGVVKLVKAGYAPSDMGMSFLPTVIRAGSQNGVASDAANTGSAGSSYAKASGGLGEPGVVSTGNDPATNAAVPSSSVPSRLEASADDALVGEASPSHQGPRSLYASGAWHIPACRPRYVSLLKGEIIEDADRMTVSDSHQPPQTTPLKRVHNLLCLRFHPVSDGSTLACSGNVSAALCYNHFTTLCLGSCMMHSLYVTPFMVHGGYHIVLYCTVACCLKYCTIASCVSFTH